MYNDGCSQFLILFSGEAQLLHPILRIYLIEKLFIKGTISNL